MDSLFVVKGQLQQIYARYSKYIDKAIQFILALVTFYMINHDIGFMKMAANPVVTFGLSVICTFLPPIVTVLFAAALILAHIFTVSIGMMAVTAVVFLIMFIFYLRFTPKMAVIVLLTPLAFMLKIPYVIPVAFGLVGVPAYVVPITCGTIVYYMIQYVKSSSLAVKDAGGLLTEVTTYLKQVFQNKEMWVVVLAFIICLFVVYNVRRMAINHAWKVGILAGAVVNIVFIAVGDMVLSVHASYGALIGGNIAAIVAGLILEFLFFAVDYSRGESLQYEDDEYYYFVKAVPKIDVAAPEKTVKRINRRDDRQETEIIDTEEIRRKTAHPDETERERPAKGQASRRPARAKAPSAGRPAAKKAAPKKRSPQAKSSKVTGNTEHLLLTQSLRKELNLDADDR